MRALRNIFAVFKKEMRSYFTSPIAYVIVAVFLAITAYFYNTILKLFVQFQFQRMFGFGGGPNLTDHFVRPFYSNMAIIFLLITPVITMRLFSEEKKLGTFELLLTSPLTTTQLVLGKYFAGLCTFLIMLLLTLPYPIFLFIYSSPEIGPIISTYLGMILIGSAFIGVGAFTSALTENQIIAAALSFGILLILWVLGWASQTASGGIAEFLKYISIMEHFGDMSKGVISTRNLIYFLSFDVFIIFITASVIESQKWR